MTFSTVETGTRVDLQKVRQLPDAIRGRRRTALVPRVWFPIVSGGCCADRVGELRLPIDCTPCAEGYWTIGPVAVALGQVLHFRDDAHGQNLTAGLVWMFENRCGGLREHAYPGRKVGRVP